MTKGAVPLRRETVFNLHSSLNAELERPRLQLSRYDD